MMVVTSAVALSVATSMGNPVQGPKGEEFAAPFILELITFTFGSNVDAGSLVMFSERWLTVVTVQMASAGDWTRSM